MTGAVGVYTEFPVDLVTNIHFKKKNGGDSSPCVDSDLLCNHYGYGQTIAWAPGPIITSVPFGPNQNPPFVGTYSTIGTNGPGGIYGGVLHPIADSNGNLITTLTGSTGGSLSYIAQFLQLTGSSLIFTNFQLLSLVDPISHATGWEEWIVPMAEGSVCTQIGTEPGGVDKDGNPIEIPVISPIPQVIKSFTINMAWQTAGRGDLVGVGISHPLTATGIVTPPPVPQFPVGSLGGGGSGSVTYDFKYAEWAAASLTGDYIITEANQYDVGVGGPAFVWWMTNRGTGWTAASEGPFMLGTINALGDWYTWEVVAACQPLPI